MKLLLTIALLAATPVLAADKIWVDETCVAMLESTEAGFVFSTMDGAYTNTCEVASWPISDAKAVMSCKDGSQTTMELIGQSVVFNGWTLLPKGDKAILCD
jgi:hypothetical protein